MANPKTNKEKLFEKYGVTGKYAKSKAKSQGEQKISVSPSRSGESEKHSGNSAKEKLLEKYGVTGKYASASKDFNTEAKNAYTSSKNTANTINTRASGLTEKERETRIKEINSEMRVLNNTLAGLGRAANYGGQGDWYRAKTEEAKKRKAELSEELKSLERVGTFTASELKQFEIDDAKSKKAALPAYNPTAQVAPHQVDAFKESINAHSEIDKKIDTLEHEKNLYDDIVKFGDVVHEDDFSGQFRANYRSSDLSREADKAMSRYIADPTEENKQIAYAYDAFSKAYMKNNEKALDDENVKASWITKSAAGYLPQFRDTFVPELLGGAVGGMLGGTAGASIGAGMASYAQMYDVIRGSVYRTLLAEGVSEKIALKAAEDEAFISSLIEGGETALSWVLAGGTKALSAIGNAAKRGVAKGSTNVATGLVAKMASKATRRAATKAARAATRPLWEKGLRAAGGIVGNALTEYSEEFAQEAVSTANRERALSGADTGLIRGTGKIISDAVTGKNPEALSRMHEAGAEGFKIGLMFGGGQTVVNNAISHYANAKTIEAQNEELDKIRSDDLTLTSFMEKGKASGKGTVAEKIAAEIETAREKGKVITRDQVRRLVDVTKDEMQTTGNVSTEQTVSAGQQTTESDALEKAARDVVAKRNRKGDPLYERLEALSQNNEPITVEDVKKATGLGDEGAKLIAELTNKEGKTFSQAEKAVKTAYMAGFSNIEGTKVNFATETQINAFTAGKKDRVMQGLFDKEKAKNATVYDGVFTENEHTKNFTKAERTMISTFAKSFGMDVSSVDEIIANVVNGRKYEANAEHQDGQMRISSTAEKVISEIVLHEGGHRMRQLAPAEFGVLMDALYERAEGRSINLGVSQGLIFDSVKAEHDNAGITMNTSGYMEEFAVRELETIFKSAEEFNKWYAEISGNQQIKTAWKKFMDFITELIDDIKRIFAEAKMSKEEKAEAKKTLDELEHIKELYANAYKAAENAVTERTKEVRSAETKSAEDIDIETKKGYNGNRKHSLKWRTDLNAAQYRMVENWIRQAGNPETTRIIYTANWYKGRIDGKDLFVIYSTQDATPTILYERKGVEAKAELDILLEHMEDIENGRSIVEISKNINTVLSGDWMQEKHDLANHNDRFGERRSDTGYASVLQGESSKFIGSPAFRNVIKNLFDIQERDGNLNESKNFSLKGGVSTTELLDTIDNVRNGKKNAVNRLYKYVDSGAISTELYDELIEKYGAITSGERPHRDIQVPLKTEKNKKVSQTVRTILEAKATPDEAVPTIEKMVEDGVFSYDAYTDKQAIGDADTYIKEYGWDESLDDWFDAVEKGEVSKQITAMGWALYNNAANIAATTTSETERTTAIKTSLKLLDAMARHQRNAAQALQATRILKKLSPETQLYGVQKSVQALQKELTDKYGKKAPNLKINEELAEQFLNAKTKDERLAAEIEIYKDIGRQTPSNWLDKWNEWRYIAMLFNLRTHGRNILGNAAFAPIVFAKDLTATAIESVVYRVSNKKMVRGKAIIAGNKADRALLKAAWGDYGNVADMVSNGGKYNDSALANQYIEEGRRIFKFKPLERTRKGSNWLLEKEDMWFSKIHYAYALAQYCKANNITAEQIDKGKAIAPAREYAIKEAQKATYRDTNAFSQFISGLGRSGKKNGVTKAAGYVVEGVLPFRKTPANILVRGVEYSPLGLLKGLTYDLHQVSKGKMSASEAIDNISAGLTGIGLLALGIYLAAQGVIRGHGEEEGEEKEFRELMGHQAYAIELPNGESITLDWLAPEALPFFVGVNIWEATKGTKEEVNFSTMLNAISGISEPMLEMSCLQGLNDVIEGVGYASSNDTSGLIAILSSAVTSYLMQGLPTLLGQAERTSEKNRMTSYTEKNSFLTKDMQYTLGKASAKIPFWDYNQIPYIDAWGRKEASGTALKRGLNNFLNPAYTSTIEASDMEAELLRLYEKTGEGGVFPERADKYFTVGGERKDLTAEEYVRYATLKGEKSYKLVSDLVKSKVYKKLSDEEKLKAVKEAYDYANQKAKQSISNYKPETWVKKADEFGSDVGNYISFKANVSGTKEDNGGKISKQEVVDIILEMAQNDSETWKMYLSMYDSKNDMHAYNKGIQGKDYMDFLVSLNKYDKPTDSGKYGSYTQKEAENAIKNLRGLSRQEKATLWQSVNTDWKAKNNPFK